MAMAKKVASTRAYRPPANDNISKAFEALNLVPDEYRGTERFLDVVAWNLRWFNADEKARVDNVTGVLAQINADIFVFEEIQDGALDGVRDRLLELKAGTYKVAYGTTGGDQRVAIMYDTTWVRAKDDVGELLSRGQVKTAEGKDVFPRLPLRGYFVGLAEQETWAFDFQLVGVHLKSQMGSDHGEPQRRMAAEWLATWLDRDAALVDADVVVMGDWNEPPSADTWSAIKNLEDQGRARFASINDDSSISHLMYQNKTTYGSRLDLQAVSVAASRALVGNAAVVRWKSLDQVLADGGGAKALKAYIKNIRENVSDHMPIISRFYWTEPNPQ
jgi:endonuclease/exonuclease/phosphatase family metal-dependent hydrolase